ncbi:MAG: glutathione S-transferase [Alphaproteobacteria bacterium MedPE-SWcel]|nr:MAG: glutathione S-transferase [Alphaproteobacteria bacterium MedPE-SWcel]
MILYDYILSPSCYKLRLLASLLDVPLELRAVDFHPGREHKGAALLALNPAGCLPILVDGDLVLTESAAILAYLAAQSGPNWLADGDPQAIALQQQWLSFSHRLAEALGGARLVEMLHFDGDLEALQSDGIAALRELEAALFTRRIAGGTFLVGDMPSIADIACFPYVALAPDGSISLDPYPSIRLWMRALRSLPGFIEMPGIHRLHELAPDPFAKDLS